MTIINPFKHWKTIIGVVIFKLLTIPAAFASMGSTGGGDSGSSSTGGGSDSSSSDGSWDIYTLLKFGELAILYFLIVKGTLFLREFRDTSKVKGLNNWMLTPNMTIYDFNLALRNKHIRLTNGQKLDDRLAQSLIDTYAQAQFTYGQAIRHCFTSNKDYLNVLKRQLGHTFLVTMKKEIKSKAAAGVIDDVMVNNGRIVTANQISPDLIIAKIQANGLDNEVNVLSQFKSSFKRKRWADYVIFGREENSAQWKIYNIIYGAHFHLNGEDYNKQASLDNAGFTEQHLEVTPELAKAAKSYRWRAKIKEKLKSFIVIPLTGLLILAVIIGPEELILILEMLWSLLKLFIDLFF